MSAPRRRRELTWTDDAGNEYGDSWWTSERGASLGSIPQRDRLVSAHCLNRHLIAALVPNGDGDPFVKVHSLAGPPRPAYVLLAGGLVEAWLFKEEQGDVVRALDAPREKWSLRCPICPLADNMYWLDAQQLRDAVSRGRQNLGLRRVEPA